MERSVKSLVWLLAVLVLSSGCATVVNGTRQAIGIASNPSNATVWVDARYAGQTPVIVEMTRKDNHIVRIELYGYLPYEITFTRQVSGWVFGNIVFGGFIGVAVDAVSGGLYRLTPEQVQAELRSNALAYGGGAGDGMILFVLKPDPSWQKIDNLVVAR